jgi:hypothetical protein
LVQSAFFAAPAVLATPLLPKGVKNIKFNDWLMGAGKETSWGLAVDEFVGFKKRGGKGL